MRAFLYKKGTVEDLDLFIRMAEDGCMFANLDKVLINFRVHKNQKSISEHQKAADEKARLLRLRSTSANLEQQERSLKDWLKLHVIREVNAEVCASRFIFLITNIRFFSGSILLMLMLLVGKHRKRFLICLYGRVKWKLIRSI